MADLRRTPARGGETPALPPARDALVDAQGRRIAYLRLSLTGRCNFRCTYCAPSCAERDDGLLSRAEIAALVRAFALLGVRRVRLTGGEPTLRPDLLAIAADVRGTPGIEEVALTTNGQRLHALARELRRAGISRLNVSLDTLRPERLVALSGRAASLARILRGIDAAAGAGFESLKINTVALRGVNHDELGALARHAWRHGAIPRFIELMPFGKGDPLTVAEAKALLGAQGVRLSPADARGWGPAYYMEGDADGAGAERGLVGFIGAMSECFCATCNRLRVAADGRLRPCLGGRGEVSLRDVLDDPARLEARVRGALAQKPARHGMAGWRPGASEGMADVGG